MKVKIEALLIIQIACLVLMIPKITQAMGNGLMSFVQNIWGPSTLFKPNFSAMVSQRQLNDPFTLGLTLIKELATTVGCLFFCAVINNSLSYNDGVGISTNFSVACFCVSAFAVAAMCV